MICFSFVWFFLSHFFLSKFVLHFDFSTLLFFPIYIVSSTLIMLESNQCARLTIDNITILSPNHRPKPPPSTLTLIDNYSGRKP
jgi:hypothetical protein